jgi:predicted secreted hydrolase
VLALALIAAFWFGFRNLNRAQEASFEASLVLAANSTPVASEAYTRATAPTKLQFPDDFGAHPDYQTEWWYYTGNLDTPDSRHFGYQLTFFRRALAPPGETPQRTSDWAANQAYMAHFAFTDVSAGKHRSFERISRGAAGLAGAQANPYQVWLEDWSVEETSPGEYHLVARQDDLVLDLRLNDLKGPILHGEQGYSRKGLEPGNASYYYSQTRLQTDGMVNVGGIEFPVTGLSWKDHEYSTSALSPGQVGWDWFAIQLDDRSELMVFQLRREDGSIDPYSSGTLISPDGNTRSLGKDDFSIQVLEDWESPVSGAVYPSRWRLDVPSASLSLEISPYLADQEMDVSYNYWEGAVKVSGKNGDQPVSGNGYVELTGYADSLSGEF